MKIKPSTSIEDMFAQIVLQQLDSVHDWQPIAIVGSDPEGVHQLRVSLRKIRSAFALFKPLIKCQYTKQQAQQLRNFSKSLDDARDLDVYLAGHFAKSDSHPLALLAEARRQLAYKRVRKLLTSDAFHHCLKKLKKEIKHHHWQDHLSKPQKKVLKQPICDFANQVLTQKRQEILSVPQLSDETDDELLHDLRIDFKKLRYAAEFFSNLYGNQDMKLFIRQVKQLQDNLGDIHDCYVIKQLHQKILPENCDDETIISEMKQIELMSSKHAYSIRSTLYEHYRLFCHHSLPDLKHKKQDSS